MMKIIKILLVLTVLFISISAVSAEGNFTALQNEINSSGDSIDIKNDYVYDNATDYSYNEGILVNKSNFTINGNGQKYKDGSTFNVLVLNGEGKPMTNAKVTFNVNGVFYTRYTNSSGMAKLNINLMAGEYIITSEFDEMKISNTITIRD